MSATPLYQVEALAEQASAPAAAGALPPALQALIAAIAAAEPARLRTLDAFLANYSKASRRAWEAARNHSNRLKAEFYDAYTSWAAAQPADQLCARCGYYALGGLCAQCAEEGAQEAAQEGSAA